MSRGLRAFLVWVMVIAMPVQGLAASVMLFCGPGHDDLLQGPAAGASSSGSGHAGDAVHEAAATDHGEHDPAASNAPVASYTNCAGHADDMGSLSPHHGKFSCSACAACCPALALPAGFELPEAERTAQAMRSSAMAPITSHQPDRLDRPPRAFLA